MLCPGIAKTIIQNFEPDLVLSWKFGVFILFCEMTSGGKNLRVVPKSYITLCNSGSRFKLPNFTIFEKIDGFEKIKMVTCRA